MSKAWIIIKGSGKYSDRWTCPERVYLDESNARADMEKLESVYNRYQKLIYPLKTHWMPDHQATAHYGPIMIAEYASVGFKADWSDDWELAEAELAE